MNVYDFDHTVYAGDCTLDFWRFCVGKRPEALRAFPGAFMAAARFWVGLCTRVAFKEAFYRFLLYVPEAAQYLEPFWEQNLRKIRPWYLEQKREDDLLISASPDFLISPACAALGARGIASLVDIKSGKLLGPNCRGEEKVRRLFQRYPQAVVESFYSDSPSDAPLAALALRAFLVRNGKPCPWEFPQP